MTSTARSSARIALWLARLTLSTVFIYAGAVKVNEPRAFAESIASFRLLPTVLIDPVAMALPVLEIIAGILALTSGRWRRVGVFCLLTLLAVFMIAVVTALARGVSVDCGCFGADKFDVLSPTKNLWVVLARDAVLGALASLLYVNARLAERQVDGALRARLVPVAPPPPGID